MAFVVVFMVTGSAPQLVVDNLLRMLFFAALFALVSDVFLKDRIRSRVTTRYTGKRLFSSLSRYQLMLSL